ncbi:MAG: hypothetical protein EP315_08660 [Gammaproteobacteria bacterium]|nr:MAG: hypothetical protein EP315_08660 [Gammaproteobacteria bacterium]
MKVKKSCPRCQQTFQCESSGTRSCPCDRIPLNEAQRDYIANHYSDCLCPNCLVDLSKQYLQQQLPAINGQTPV